MTATGRTYWTVAPQVIAAVALVAALVGGILGGLIVARLAPSTSPASPARVAPPALIRPAPAAVMEQARAWERQYHELHPAALDPVMVAYGRAWQQQYEEQHPQR